MTLRLDAVPADVERALKAEAARLGTSEAEVAIRLLRTALSLPAKAAAEQPAIDRATVALLQRWDAEDATHDPAELARREQEWQEFRRAMNAHSLSGRPVYP